MKTKFNQFLNYKNRFFLIWDLVFHLKKVKATYSIQMLNGINQGVHVEALKLEKKVEDKLHFLAENENLHFGLVHPEYRFPVLITPIYGADKIPPMHRTSQTYMNAEKQMEQLHTSITSERYFPVERLKEIAARNIAKFIIDNNCMEVHVNYPENKVEFTINYFGGLKNGKAD